MEDEGNLRLVCKGCSEKMYPNKGTFDVQVGDFAKLKFTDGDDAEYMWVQVTKADKDSKQYEGRLDNDPVLVQSVAYNDNVEFKKEDILQVT